MSTASSRSILWKYTIALSLLLTLSILAKLAVWHLHPQIFNNSPDYVVSALNLLEGRGYGTQENGFRSPTYLLFLLVVLAPFDLTHLAECQDAHGPVCLGNAAKTVNGQFGLRVIVAAQISGTTRAIVPMFSSCNMARLFL